MIFTCERCGYQTDRLRQFNKHKNRKVKCPLPRKGDLKYCIYCENYCHISEFHLRKDSPDGLRNNCMKCQAERCKNWREENAEYCTLVNKKKYADHREERIAYTKRWNEANREHRKKYRYDYWRKNKTELAAYHKDRRERIRCEHGKNPYQCTACKHDVCPRNICQICMDKLLSKNNYKHGICAGCQDTLMNEGIFEFKRVEIEFRDYIIEYLDFEPSALDVSIAEPGGQCSDLPKRRPDMVFVHPDMNCVVVIEVDEDSHANRAPECETAKISQQNEAIQRCRGLENVPVITLRVNPDKYDYGYESLSERAREVANRVEEIMTEFGVYAMHDEEPDITLSSVEYWYYDSKSNHLIEEQGKTMNVVVHPEF